MLSQLVKIDVAALGLGKSAQQIFDLVDGGTVSEVGLFWVFNLATDPAGHRRELRFWRPELAAREGGNASRYHGENIDWVISQILPGNREVFHAGEVSALLQIRHNTRRGYGLQLPGRLVQCRNIYSRPALERFLRQRWLGNTVRPVNPALARCASRWHTETEAAI
jgi:hypothetical protein